MSSRARISAACLLALVLLAGVLVATATAANEGDTEALNEDAVSVSSASLTNAEQLEALLEADEAEEALPQKFAPRRVRLNQMRATFKPRVIVAPLRVQPRIAARVQRKPKPQPKPQFKSARSPAVRAPFVQYLPAGGGSGMMCTIFLEVDGETREVADPNCGGQSSQAAPPKPLPFWATPRPTVKQSVCTIGWVLSNDNAYVCGALAMKITAGLHAQVAAQMAANGISFSSMKSLPQILSLTGDPNLLNPQMQDVAMRSLAAAVASTGRNRAITISGAFRTSTQQFMWYTQGQAKRCGLLPKEAAPGTSSFEAGLAFENAEAEYWWRILAGYGFSNNGASTFSYVYPDGVQPNVAVENLKAFQQLWNKNNPNEQIVADGKWRPQTANVMVKAPCKGW